MSGPQAAESGREGLNQAAADVLSKCEAKAKALAEAGRSNNLKRLTGQETRDEVNDSMVSWAFFRLCPEHFTSYDRAASEEARVMNAVQACMDYARSDERRRIAEAVAKAMKKLLGDEAERLVEDVAEALGVGGD